MPLHACDTLDLTLTLLCGTWLGANFGAHRQEAGLYIDSQSSSCNALTAFIMPRERLTVLLLFLLQL
jgi:hypothetical protein